MKTFVIAVASILAFGHVATAAEVVINITAVGENTATATVTLDTAKKTWIGKNDTDTKVLSATKGTYLQGPTTTPGYTTSGVFLIVDGKKPTDKNSLDTTLFDLKSSDSTSKTGKAQMYLTGSVGTWARN